MGIYYFLVNDDKKQRFHLDYNIKGVPVQYNEAVHYAFINYMFEHQGCSFGIVADFNCEEYEEIDLL